MSLAPAFPGNSQQQGLFQSFQRHIAPNLGGYFDSDFWNYSLPRISHSNSPVLFAVLAIAACDESASSRAYLSGCGGNEQSIFYYNKAIASLKTRMADGAHSRLTILLTCLLFICLEYKRGNAGAALSHLQSGLNILCAIDTADVSVSELSDIRGKLIKAFYRLSVQGSLVGQYPPIDLHLRFKGATGFTQDHFTSLTEARDSLVSMFIEFLRPASLTPDSSVFQDPSYDDWFRRADYMTWLRQWDSKMGMYIIDCVPGPSAEDMLAIRSLRIQNLVATVWNMALLSSATGDLDECAFDAHIDKFENILSHAALCINNTKPMTKKLIESSELPSVAFSFDMGVVFALYFTAIKCRSPHIRRQATDLLTKVYPQREGMWDARALAVISQYARDFEESGCTMTLTEDTQSWPLREQRIHGIYPYPQYDLARRTQQVQFVWRPLGVNTEWEGWVKTISF